MTRFGAADLSANLEVIYQNPRSHRRDGSGMRKKFLMDRNGWIELLAIERQHGPDTPYWLEDRINELLHEGEAAEANRLLKLAKIFSTLHARTTLQ